MGPDRCISHLDGRNPLKCNSKKTHMNKSINDGYKTLHIKKKRAHEGQVYIQSPKTMGDGKNSKNIVLPKDFYI